MRQVAVFCSLIFSLMCGLSCRADGAELPPKHWTVMIYMNAKNNLESAALINFRDIASVGSSPDVDIVIALGRLNTHQDCELCNRYPWGGLLFFHVLPKTNPAEAEAIERPKHTDMGSPDSLVEFVQFARQRFPSKHYALIIWGHGYGFSFLNVMQTNRGARQTDLLENCILRLPAGPTKCETPSGPVGGMKAVSRDPETNHVLFNRQIEESLKQVLGNNPKLDIIGFDACLMASVEIAYGMRKVADYLVASEDLVPDCGWEYRDPLARLVEARGSASGKDLALSFVEAYKNRFHKGPAYATLSAIDLSRLDNLATGISNLADALTDTSKPTMQKIEKARNGCRVFGRDDGYKNPIDLKEFLRNLQASGANNARVLKAVSAVLAILDSQEFIVKRFSGAAGSFGLTIYFPPDERAYTDNPDTLDNDAYDRAKCNRPLENHAIEFVCDQRWSVFLPAYYSELKSINSLESH